MDRSTDCSVTAARHVSTFNAFTGTALARLHKKDKWLGFGGALVASQPLRQAAATLGVHRNTALRWRHRFLNGFKADRAPTPKGVTEADETYFLESRKGCCKLDRPARRRGGTSLCLQIQALAPTAECQNSQSKCHSG